MFFFLRAGLAFGLLIVSSMLGLIVVLMATIGAIVIAGGEWPDRDETIATLRLAGMAAVGLIASGALMGRTGPFGNEPEGGAR